MSHSHPDPSLKDSMNSQLSLLKEPLEIDESISEILSSQARDKDIAEITNSQLQDVLNRVNKSLSIQYEERYTERKDIGAAKSATTFESEKFHTIDQCIFKVYNQLQSFDLSNYHDLPSYEKREMLQKLSELLADLPVPKHLRLADAQLLEKYTDIRTKLMASNRSLRYHFDKLQYLQRLNSTFEETFGTGGSESNTTTDNLDNLQDQIHKFKLLVERIAYKSSMNDLHSF
ncbi:hypothetical protein KGF57_001268 [Candida theae]|uniref:Uncharacterized protein n=1 Tax=Candida theae TaxID=1198502 RepID=A0AAD5BHB2_9ASCO|nr:uncharacterized protein KGF57_001268 [Candida theae]KAI5963390.1 hypothetical protein KGF57_001268 [Candida theae]